MKVGQTITICLWAVSAGCMWIIKEPTILKVCGSLGWLGGAFFVWAQFDNHNSYVKLCDEYIDHLNKDIEAANGESNERSR